MFGSVTKSVCTSKMERVVEDGLILQFGKYKGLSIEDIMESDDKYVQWLLQQDWFRRRFSHVFEYVRNNNTVDDGVPKKLPPVPNPIRNRMQNLFLRSEFVRELCISLFRARVPGYDSVPETNTVDCSSTVLPDRKRLADRNDGETRVIEFGWERKYGGYVRKVLRIHLEHVISSSVSEFETVDGYDVRIVISKCCPANTYSFTDDSVSFDSFDGMKRITEKNSVEGVWSIVLKPLLGLDYTRLLRRTHEKPRDGSKVMVVVARYECGNVTSKEELRQLFHTDDVSIVFLEDMESKFTRYVFDYDPTS